MLRSRWGRNATAVWNRPTVEVDADFELYYRPVTEGYGEEKVIADDEAGDGLL